MQLIVNILYSFSTMLCIALSFNLIYRAAKFFDMAHAFTITLAAYLFFFFSKQCGILTPVSLFLAVALSTGAGMLSELYLYRRLRGKGASSMMLMIASLGLYTMLTNCLSIFCGDDTKIICSGDIEEGFLLIGAHITKIQTITIFIGLLVFVSFSLYMKYCPIGRNIRAVSCNPELSAIIGINSDKTILISFGISSALASVAGILVAFETGATTSMGFNLLLNSMVAMIIGGSGSIWGLFFGALMLSSIQQVSAYFIGSQWMNAVAYIILIIFLLWRPFGFSGRKLKKVEI